MMSRILMLLGSFLTVLSFSVSASAQTMDAKRLALLSQHPTWLKLLYFNRAQQRSEVTSADYFLSPQGRTHPLAELKATLSAYDAPFGDAPNQHARCRFPARYYWLSRQVDLNDYHMIDARCTQLQTSFDKNRIDSLSVMFVTGYLGNPASSFGHSFIKLNQQTELENGGLFDLAISYGADVPENENVFLYMYRGLFGQYQARFTDKYFYTQDLVYSSNEFRDIWEYRLKLSDEQVTLFRLHLWEILGQTFQYYFLDQNCGYEVSRMLEVVMDEKLVADSNVWFAPIETFHTLAQQDEPHPVAARLIDEVVFHPSERKKIYRKYQTLSRHNQQVARALIQSELDWAASGFNDLKVSQKTDVVHFVTSYYTYLLFKAPQRRDYQLLKREALLQRFQLPPKGEAPTIFENLVTPHESDPPSIWFGGVNWVETGSHYGSLGYAPYAVQSLGKNNLHGDELVVLKTDIGFEAERVFLNRFDLIKIKRFNTHTLPMDEGLGLSWQLDVGAETLGETHADWNVFARGGLGKAWANAHGWMGYGLLNLAVHSDAMAGVAYPELGVRWDAGATKVWVSGKTPWFAKSELMSPSLEAQALVSMTKTVSLEIRLQQAQTASAYVGWQVFH